MLPQATGVDTYLLELLRGLGAVDATNRYSVFINREDRRRLPALEANFRVYAVATRSRPVRLLWQQLGLPTFAALNGVDVIHSPSFLLPLAAPGAAQVLSVHDVTPFTHPQTHIPLRRSAPYLAALRASIRRAHVISVPTASVHEELAKLMPSVQPRIRVVPYGISDDFNPAAAGHVAATRAALGLKRPYLLFVGTVQPRKNLLMLLDAYRRLVATNRVEEDLVIAGMLGWEYEAIAELARAPEFDGRVRLLGYVDRSLLAGLYAGASLFAYPSLAEGFGFPAVEAMACGTAVIASDLPVFRELLDGAAELVPFTDPISWANAIARLLGDDDLRAERRRLGIERAEPLRWEATARATIACYEKALERGSARSH